MKNPDVESLCSDAITLDVPHISSINSASTSSSNLLNPQSNKKPKKSVQYQEEVFEQHSSTEQVILNTNHDRTTNTSATNTTNSNSHATKAHKLYSTFKNWALHIVHVNACLSLLDVFVFSVFVMSFHSITPYFVASKFALL